MLKIGFVLSNNTAIYGIKIPLVIKEPVFAALRLSLQFFVNQLNILPGNRRPTEPSERPIIGLAVATMGRAGRLGVFAYFSPAAWTVIKKLRLGILLSPVSNST